MKKLILSSALLISAGSYFIFDSINSGAESTKIEQDVKKETPTKILNSHAKTDGFSSLEELEKESPIIVKGVKSKELGQEIYRSKVDNSNIGGYTKTEFKIEEVIKNSDNNKLIENGKTITIGELEYEENNVIYTTNGYQKMKNGEEYLLYLVEEDGIYAPIAVTFGKMPLNTNNLEIYSDEQISNKEVHLDEDSDIEVEKELQVIFDEARDKYKEK